ncbi:MAG TPA: hypothetical protein VFQ55_01695, partial [Casimicrobiaceae bacterium]|nr:hypothetical protein [Casimicrobiaceae bacterium]
MRRAASIVMAGALAAGCAALPGTSPADITLYDDDVAPLIIEMTPPMDSPPLEPIEPVEPPLQAPPLMPSPSPAPPAAAPAAQPPPTAVPPPQDSQGTGAPAGNVLAAASQSTLPSVNVIPAEDLAALTLISDLQRYNALGAEDVRRELNAATSALARERTDANRVRLAVLYTLSHASPQDDQRALQLLDNVARSGGGATPVKALAAV